MDKSKHNNKNENFNNIVIHLKNLIRDIDTPFYLYNIDELIKSATHFIEAYKKNIINNPLGIYSAIFTNNNLFLHNEICNSNPSFGIAVNSPAELDAVINNLKLPPDKIRYVGGIQPLSILKYVSTNQVIPHIASIEQLSQYCDSIPESTKIGLRIDVLGDGLKGIKANELPLALEIIKKASCKIYSLHGYPGTNVLDEHRLLRFALELFLISKQIKPAVKEINLSGGFGYDYVYRKPAICLDTYFNGLNKILKNHDIPTNIKICFEPGRILFVNSGYFITKIVDVKKISNIHYNVFTDACFTQFPSPKLTNTFHQAFVVDKTGNLKKGMSYLSKICGASTLSTDQIIPGLCELNNPEPGDFVIVLDAGAYGRVGSYHFLGFPKPPEYAIKDDKVILIRDSVNDPLEIGLQRNLQKD